MGVEHHNHHIELPMMNRNEAALLLAQLHTSLHGLRFAATGQNMSFSDEKQYKIIDVTGDGNCGLYAFAVGLIYAIQTNSAALDGEKLFPLYLMLSDENNLALLKQHIKKLHNARWYAAAAKLEEIVRMLELNQSNDVTTFIDFVKKQQTSEEIAALAMAMSYPLRTIGSTLYKHTIEFNGTLPQEKDGVWVGQEILCSLGNALRSPVKLFRQGYMLAEYKDGLEKFEPGYLYVSLIEDLHKHQWIRIRTNEMSADQFIKASMITGCQAVSLNEAYAKVLSKYTHGILGIAHSNKWIDQNAIFAYHNDVGVNEQSCISLLNVNSNHWKNCLQVTEANQAFCQPFLSAQNLLEIFTEEQLAKNEALKRLFDLVVTFATLLNDAQNKYIEHGESYRDIYLASLGMYETLVKNIVDNKNNLQDIRKLKLNTLQADLLTFENNFKTHRGWHAYRPIVRYALGIVATLTIVPALVVALKSESGYWGTFFKKKEDVKTASALELEKVQSQLTLILPKQSEGTC